MSNFQSLGIAPNILDILEKSGFTTPTPIQERSIPSSIEGKDLVGIAQTGTGKTLAFAIPMIQAALRGDKGLIVVPTRELALQVQETFGKVGVPLGIKSVVLIGGEAIGRQLQQLRRNPHVVIGTPGRIIDHLEQKTVSLSGVKILTLDEADRMFDMGFAPQLKRILSVLPPPDARQTLLFSATMPEDIVRIARAHMKLPVRVEIAPQGTAAEKVTQEVFFVQRQDKSRLLEKILAEGKGSTLIFARMKYSAKRIAAGLRVLGHSAAEIHSNRSLMQRKEALEGFKNGRYRILVATDIAARGIDVKGIALVVNYDLPASAEDYVHRIGRTGRMGGVGHAVSFATPNEKGGVRSIERLIRSTLPLSKLPEDLPPARAETMPEREPFQRFGNRSPRFSSSAPRSNYGRTSARPYSSTSSSPYPRPSFGRRPPSRGGFGNSSPRPGFSGHSRRSR
ncbi:MAG: DEAD/DEAH box helicase [Patescibacteria group bacterium]|nr:DEAD/DEAH box helicase [Patescibacteria group bacterium]